MQQFLFRGAALGLSLLTVSASAATMTLPSIQDDFGSNAPSFSTDSLTFTLPTGFTNAVLQTETFSVDDRAVMELNGVVVSSSGIYGPGNGRFYFTNGGPNNPFTFQYGNSGPFAPITTGFVVGVNTLTFIVNNTNNGIYGGPRGGPSSLYFDGTLSFGGVVPEPSTWAMMLIGIGGLGAVLRSRLTGIAAG